MVVKTREFKELVDTGFILETMPKAVYYDTRRGPPDKKWFAEYFAYLQPLLKTAHIVIACDESDPDFVLGYAVMQRLSDCEILEFVYVKGDYRKQGIATMLLKSTPYTAINVQNMTKLGKKILDQKSNQQEKQMAKAKEQPQKIAQENKDEKSRLEKLIESGIPITKITFQSAIISGHNTAESQLDLDSSNVQRRPEAMTYCGPFGVVITHNGYQWIEPLANVIQAWVTKAPGAKSVA